MNDIKHSKEKKTRIKYMTDETVWGHAVIKQTSKTENTGTT